MYSTNDWEKGFNSIDRFLICIWAFRLTDFTKSVYIDSDIIQPSDIEPEDIEENLYLDIVPKVSVAM